MLHFVEDVTYQSVIIMVSLQTIGNTHSSYILTEILISLNFPQKSKNFQILFGSEVGACIIGERPRFVFLSFTDFD